MVFPSLQPINRGSAIHCPFARTSRGLCAHVVYQIHHRKHRLCSTTSMSTTATLKPGNQLWGIYHTDREYARVMGDPLRTVVEAPTKLAAEETAARLGF